MVESRYADILGMDFRGQTEMNDCEVIFQSMGDGVTPRKQMSAYVSMLSGCSLYTKPGGTAGL